MAHQIFVQCLRLLFKVHKIPSIDVMSLLLIAQGDQNMSTFCSKKGINDVVHCDCRRAPFLMLIFRSSHLFLILGICPRNKVNATIHPALTRLQDRLLHGKKQKIVEVSDIDRH